MLAKFVVMKLNVEDLRYYCLSMGVDVEEKMPFGKFPGASEVLVFYVCGHMFCYYDLSHFKVVTVKCHPKRIAELRANEAGITEPYNMRLAIGSALMWRRLILISPWN